MRPWWKTHALKVKRKFLSFFPAGGVNSLGVLTNDCVSPITGKLTSHSPLSRYVGLTRKIPYFSNEWRHNHRHHYHRQWCHWATTNLRGPTCEQVILWCLFVSWNLRRSWRRPKIYPWPVTRPLYIYVRLVNKLDKVHHVQVGPTQSKYGKSNFMVIQSPKEITCRSLMC